MAGTTNRSGVHELAFLFRRLGEQMRRLVAEALEGRDLTPAHFLFLGRLDEPVPMGSIAGSMGKDASYVTEVVDRLEAQGLVERRAHPEDRRIRLIAITDEGRELRDRVHAHLAEHSPLARRLDPDELATMTRLLRKALE